MRPSFSQRLMFGLSLVLASSSLACGFFDELEPLGDETTGGEDTGAEDGTGDGETGDAAGCTIVDDRCDSQDVVESCDLETGELSTLNCAVLCGGSLNVTCLQGPTGQHGCWCVSPGVTALDGCGALEACLLNCTTTACSDGCFDRASTSTIRLLGALYHCAEQDCESICTETPEGCNSCILATRSGVYGNCGVERSVCDSDDVDDYPWPG